MRLTYNTVMPLTITDKNWIVGAVCQIVGDTEKRIKTEL